MKNKIPHPPKIKKEYCYCKECLKYYEELQKEEEKNNK